MVFSDGFKRHSKLFLTFIVFYSLAASLSYSIEVSGFTLQLYDLTLPVISALLILYHRRALPTLALFAVYSFWRYPLFEFLEIAAQIVAALSSAMIYFFITGKRGAVSFGRSRLTAQRIFWLILFNTAVFTLLHHWLLLKFHITSPYDAKIFSVATLINIQWMLTSCITGIPFCYLVIRACYKPKWFFSYLRQLKALIVEGPTAVKQITWVMMLVTIMYCLIIANQDFLLFTDYSLVWLLPIMLWGAICLGHALINPLWVFMLILLSHYSDSYIARSNDFTEEHYVRHLAMASSMIAIFSLTIVLVGVLATRILRYIRHLKRVSLTEPHTGLPNLRALKNDIPRYPGAGLCSVQCPELNSLTQAHGITFRFEFVKAVVEYLKPLLRGHDNIYYSPGYGILLRLDDINDTLIDSYYKAMSAFRFSWEEMELGLNFGLSYILNGSNITNLSSVVGQLNASTFVSLKNGRPETLNIDAPGENNNNPSVIRHLLQQSIDQRSFVLMAQPIVSTTSAERYHEILIRIKTGENTLLFPNTFLPVAQEAGLLAEVDMTVIEQTFRFMHSLGESHSERRFSINLTPQSLIKSDFLDRIYALFAIWSIRPHRVIFEIIESDIIDNLNASSVLRELRKLGCKIAIDDFGTGASSYSRLKNLEADILKIDGSFIRNIVAEKFDHFIVMSFCEAAKFKNLEVVAEFVESEEIKQMLINMGIGWLQGYHTGKPVLIESLKK